MSICAEPNYSIIVGGLGLARATVIVEEIAYTDLRATFGSGALDILIQKGPVESWSP
jgi:hypothetical protein